MRLVQALSAGSRRRTSLATAALAVAAALLLACTGATAALDRLLETPRYAIGSHAASGRVVIVEMDAASAAAIRRWPWSRSHYAPVVDALRRAGAASIVFDVDFAAAADAAGDAAFAAALARTEGLVALPTFGQQGSAADRRTIDALPLPAFREHVALASVSIAPDADGTVRDMPFGTMTAGTPRPSLSAFIAGRSGAADTTFPIDMGIDPATIPRLSFVAVRDGRFDPAAVRGRDVLIGATAIEMGDRYATPGWGVIPGVVVQAMAAETLLHGVPFRGSALPLGLLAALLALAIARATDWPRLAAYGAAAVVALLATVGVAQASFGAILPIAGSLVILAVAIVATGTRLVVDRMRTLRLVDEETGLPNRRALLAAPLTGEPLFAVLRIGSLESTLAVLGHGADTAIVLRVVDRVRLVAANGDVYRLSDQSLAFRLDWDNPPEDVMAALRTVMLQPVEVLGRRIDVACTVGIASGPAAEPERILNDATLAAEEAHRSGGFWQRSGVDLVDMERSITLMGELDTALAAGAIEVHYQPKLLLADDRVTSAEALVRWRHPSRGFVSPDLFIPLAEQTDRIAPLTLYVLARVLEDVARWRVDGLDATAAINISAKLLASAAFNAAVDGMLAAAPMPASALVFEVTESATMSEPEAATAALARYRALGIAVSMDDYGTGQSTLTYLRGLPLTELKIDRSFVQHAHLNRNDGILVKSTVEMAHAFGLKVVAEGVEEQACLDFLRSIGCDYVQGYLIGRALPFADFVALARTLGPPPADEAAPPRAAAC